MYICSTLISWRPFCLSFTSLCFLKFIAKVGDKAQTAKDRGLDRTCGSLLQKLCQKYDNLAEVDKLASVTKKVETVKLVMQENVDIALQNCVKLETIERAAGIVLI